MPATNEEEGTVSQAPDNPATGNAVPPRMDKVVTEDSMTGTPTPPVELYLPDMENTTLV